MTPRQHLLVAMLVAVVLPAASWADGSGFLAFRMYARAPSYRLTVTAWDQASNPRPIVPTAMAARAGGTLSHLLAGSDHWVTSPRTDFLAAHLPELAPLACRVARNAARDAPIEARRADAACP
jgi:hypothetical protein